MGKRIEKETYEFVGDSKNNLVFQMQNGKMIGTYSQTSIIRGLNENKQYVVSGKKIKSPIDNPRQAYLIYYGKDKEHVDQIVKIVIDKKNLENGDPNALAIEGMCLSSVNVKIKQWAIRALAVTSAVVVMSGIGYGIVKGFEKESKAREEKLSGYYEQLNDQRIEKGLSPLGNGDSLFEEGSYGRGGR